MKSTDHIVIILLAVLTLAAAEIRNKGWWKNMVFYQIYPRSFKDSDGDGVGDLKGIISKLDHFKDAGIGAIWLSPINRSPMVDMGYDIADFKDVDPTFGTLSDLDDLLKKAHDLGLKVILDLVPNHTSDLHYWFQMSRRKKGKYSDYYVWHDGKCADTNDAKCLPNNWLSVFGKSGWTYDQDRKQYYYHQFYSQQPDLNYNNPDVQREMKEVIRYWLNRGMDGFRIDAVPHIFENNITQDEPISNHPTAKPDEHNYLSHILTKDQPQTYELIKSWRDYVDEYANQNNRDEIILMTEAYTNLNNTLKYYNFGSHIPFNFKYITEANANSNITRFKEIADDWISGMPAGSTANWVMGNHDRNRVESRYPGKGEHMIMLSMILPGVAVTYYGEEIGMQDNTNFTFSDFRDGCRTPMQWDDSSLAGFTSGNSTWLPVHSNYLTLNLKKEKEDANSHYKVYTSLVALRKSSNALKEGDVHTDVLDNDVLAVRRSASDEIVTLLLNFKNDSVNVKLSDLLKKKHTEVKLSSVGSSVAANAIVNLDSFTLPRYASVVLVSGASTVGFSLISVLLLAAISLFRL
ncbi:alpha glucosidase 2 [Nomia melanderi]|uniref:alpha glucosidase 2 n=1 Tax=Nomia melanderi TaxID=2448451 RepID=UPI003FCDC7DF